MYTLIYLLNVGDTTTFRRAGYTETIADVSFATEGLGTRVKNWNVMEAYMASDHMYISFEIQLQRPPPGGPYRPKPRGWNLNKLNRERFIQALMMGQGAILDKPHRVGCKEDAEELVSEVMTLLKKAYDDSMPRKRFNGKTPPVYWWNVEIAKLRRQSYKIRRRATRARSRAEAGELMRFYKLTAP